MLIVAKFGGTSVSDARRIAECARKLVEEAQKGNRVVSWYRRKGI